MFALSWQEVHIAAYLVLPKVNKVPETEVAAELVLAVELFLDDKLLELALDEAMAREDDVLLTTELLADEGALDEIATELITEDGAALELAFDELELDWMLLATELLLLELAARELAARELLARTLLASELDLAELLVLLAILLVATLLTEELLFTELAVRLLAAVLLEMTLLPAELTEADELAFALLADDASITGPLLEELAATALLARLLAGELVIDEDAKLELKRLLAELAGCDNCAVLELANADDCELARLLAFALLLDVSAPLEGTEEPAPPPQPTRVNDELIAQKRRIFFPANKIRMSCPIVYSCSGQFIRLMRVKPSKRSL